jgi:hypothetical protein
MSYARWSRESDVYVFLHTGGYLDCCGCHLANNNRGGFQAYKTKIMLRHLKEHQKAGHDVPDYCIEGLQLDAKKNDRWIKRRLKQQGGVK